MKLSLGRVMLYALLVLFALYYLMPLYVLLSTSFKSLAEFRNSSLLAFPLEPTIDPWIKAWSGACTGVRCDGMAPYFWNSISMVIPAVLISTLMGALNGYVLVHWKFRGSELFFSALLIGCFIPFQVVLLPMARFLGLTGLSNSVTGLIFVHVVYGVAFTTLFFRNYFLSISHELIRAARIDGAGFWRIFMQVLVPISGPIFVVSIIWQFTQIWNDFLFGVSYGGPGSQPITTALNNLVNTSTGVKEYNTDMAAAMIAALPTLFVYLVAGRYFVRGLTAGAVKG